MLPVLQTRIAWETPSYDLNRGSEMTCCAALRNGSGRWPGDRLHRELSTRVGVAGLGQHRASDNLPLLRLVERGCGCGEITSSNAV
jgi:hypothetical protein